MTPEEKEEQKKYIQLKAQELNSCLIEVGVRDGDIQFDRPRLKLTWGDDKPVYLYVDKDEMRLIYEWARVYALEGGYERE